jgi:hypothetical protein
VRYFWMRPKPSAAFESKNPLQPLCSELDVLLDEKLSWHLSSLMCQTGTLQNWHSNQPHHLLTACGLV